MPRGSSGVPTLPRTTALRALVVYKKSAFEIYVRERKHSRVQQLLDDGDRSVRHLLRAHEHHRDSLEQARNTLQALGIKATFRHRSGPVGVDDFDLIVTMGGDGTLLWASHLVGAGLPVLAINTAPSDSVGFFAAGSVEHLGDLLSDVRRGHLSETRLTRMRVELDGELISSRVLNDVLFAHHSPAATTRFGLRLPGGEGGVGGDSGQGGQAGEAGSGGGPDSEEPCWADYKSSGIWVCTASGSTGALGSAGGRAMPPGSRRLQFRVREAYLPKGRGDASLQGFVRVGARLEIQSHIRTARLYMDGPREVRAVDIGARLTIMESEQPLSLLGFRPARPAE